MPTEPPRAAGDGDAPARLARYRLLFEQARDAVLFLRPDGAIVDANPAAVAAYGHERAALLTLTIADLRDPATAADLPDQLRRAATEGMVFQTRHRRRDGSTFPVEVSSRAVDADGERLLVSVVRDVTERERAAEAREHLAALVESAEDAIVGRTLDGTITSWNRGAERLYGYSAAEAIGRPVAMLVPAERRGELPELRERLARGERVELIEAVRRRKDGSPVEVSIALSPVRDAAGRVVGVATIARDVTERRRAEERQRLLAEAGAVLAASLDAEAALAGLARLAVPRLADWCAVHVLEEDGAIRPLAVAHADPATATWAEELGARYPLDPEAPAGVPAVLRTGRPQLHAEVTDEVLAAVARDSEHARLLRAAGMRSAIVVPMVARGRTLGALVLVAAGSGRRYGEADLALAEELAGRAALAVDNARLYAEARAAEARYRAVFAGVADAILVADAAGRYLDANPAALALLGYGRDELLGLRVPDVVARERPWAEGEYARFLAEGAWRGELELRRRDGSKVPVEAVATVVELPDGPIYLSALRDASARRALARLQEDFLAMVGHDLRSPLTAVVGQAQLMRRRRAYSERGVEAILAQAERMGRLVTDLGDVVRLEAGRLELARAPVDLAGLAREGAEQARLLDPRCPVRIEAPEVPVVALADRDRLGQVLQNLIGNAVKYSPEGSEVVVVVSAEDAEARLSVADRGIGVAPEHLPRLFDRFYRADATGAPAGLGLGLYISRMLVEAHGGRIWAESAPGEGSTFTVALPLAAEPAPTAG